MLMALLASGSSSPYSAPEESPCFAASSSVVLSSPLDLSSLRTMTRKRVLLSGRS
jgi:hypothetical protein